MMSTVNLHRLENKHIRIEIAAELGGKICSVYNKTLRREFLWINKNIPFSTQPPGAEYDHNFIGGIDELLPNDAPENIDGINYPDHGELWTTPLHADVADNTISVYGTMALSGLNYRKTISLHNDAPYVVCDYGITNETDSVRHFLWKLHAALIISKGDRLVTTAVNGLVVDPAYSRFKKELTEFKWPIIENTDASIVPEKNGSTDFFYLYNTPAGNMRLESGNAVFAYEYDTAIFPYQWWFASYGGFLDHYTAILEPCTNMPMMVNEAIEKKQSAVLKPGEALTTRVRIYAGEKNNYTTS